MSATAMLVYDYSNEKGIIENAWPSAGFFVIAKAKVFTAHRIRD